MSGPTQPWDQSGDPRESTVDLPRLDLSDLADYFRGAAPAASAPPGEPRLASRPDRGRGSDEPALPEPVPAEPLLEPLPVPDAGRFSPPGRQPAPAGFMDPYAQPRPRGRIRAAAASPGERSRPLRRASLPRASADSAPRTAPGTEPMPRSARWPVLTPVACSAQPGLRTPLRLAKPRSLTSP